MVLRADINFFLPTTGTGNFRDGRSGVPFVVRVARRAFEWEAFFSPFPGRAFEWEIFFSLLASLLPPLHPSFHPVFAPGHASLWDSFSISRSCLQPEIFPKHPSFRPETLLPPWFSACGTRLCGIQFPLAALAASLPPSTLGSLLPPLHPSFHP